MSLLATLADGLGTACVPLLPEALERAYGSDQLRATAAAVAHFPTDEAFRLLVARLDDKQVRPALQEASQRFPVRAVRLLAEAALTDGKNAPAARQLLNTQVMAHRSLLPLLLPRLEPAAAELVGSWTRSGSASPKRRSARCPPCWSRRPGRAGAPRASRGCSPACSRTTSPSWCGAPASASAGPGTSRGAGSTRPRPTGTPRRPSCSGAGTSGWPPGCWTRGRWRCWPRGWRSGGRQTCGAARTGSGRCSPSTARPRSRWRSRSPRPSPPSCPRCWRRCSTPARPGCSRTAWCGSSRCS
ncbi:hypothetical protein ACFQZC_24765 [Streptacidiphilus monticola]